MMVNLKAAPSEPSAVITFPAELGAQMDSA